MSFSSTKPFWRVVVDVWGKIFSNERGVQLIQSSQVESDDKAFTFHKVSQRGIHSFQFFDKKKRLLKRQQIRNSFCLKMKAFLEATNQPWTKFFEATFFLNERTFEHIDVRLFLRTINTRQIFIFVGFEDFQRRPSESVTTTFVLATKFVKNRCFAYFSFTNCCKAL